MSEEHAIGVFACGGCGLLYDKPRSKCMNCNNDIATNHAVLFCSPEQFSKLAAHIQQTWAD